MFSDLGLKINDIKLIHCNNIAFYQSQKKDAGIVSFHVWHTYLNFYDTLKVQHRIELILFVKKRLLSSKKSTNKIIKTQDLKLRKVGK